MALNAVKSGDAITAAGHNELLALQGFSLIYAGTIVDSKTGAGTTENDVMTNFYAIRVTATGVTSLMRVELEVAQDGAGQDLTLYLLGSDFNPNGSAEGTVLATIVVPKEFLPAVAGTYFSIILNVTGLVAGTNYWIKVGKVGDATNHFHLIGEASTDAAHPCYYRAGTTGAWTANNAIHFKAYSGNGGVPVHEIYGINGQVTIEYTSGRPAKVYLYLPPSDGSAGGIRDILTMTYASGILTEGE